MKIIIEFELDNSAFGDHHDDPQFGYGIETALKRVGSGFRGITRREVGETDRDWPSEVIDSNGNTVGSVKFEGYEPPVETKRSKLEKLFQNHELDDVLNALSNTEPDYKLPVSATRAAGALFSWLDNDHKFTDDMTDALIAEV